MLSNQGARLLPFLIELRQRLIKCVVVFAALFAVLLYFANSLYTLLALPLLKYLPVGQGVIATNIVSPFFVPFELSFMVSLFLAVPVFLYQLWVFIAPALYQRERYVIWPLLLLSIILFYVGVLFAYFVVFPLLFSFLTHAAPRGVLVYPDMGQYLDFTLKLFFVFGCIFEVPVVTVLLVWTGVTSRKTLIHYRSYAIVGAFILGMLLAPPDVLSQILVAVPLWLLFELGIFLARWVDL